MQDKSKIILFQSRIFINAEILFTTLIVYKYTKILFLVYYSFLRTKLFFFYHHHFSWPIALLHNSPQNNVAIGGISHQNSSKCMGLVTGLPHIFRISELVRWCWISDWETFMPRKKIQSAGNLSDSPLFV